MLNAKERQRRSRHGFVVLALVTVTTVFTFGVPAGGCGGSELDMPSEEIESQQQTLHNHRKGRFVRKALPYKCTVESDLEGCPNIEN